VSFLTELKRRNIFRVGVAYIIVAWLLIQVAAILLPTFQAPDWVMRVFTLFIFLGLPLAIFLAWVFELTPEGIKTASTVGPDQYHTHTTGQQLNYFILTLVVLLATFILVDNYVLVDELENTTVAPIINSTPSINPVAVDSPSNAAALPSTAASAHTPVRRTSLILGTTQPFPTSRLNAYIALSRDGRQLVYAVNTPRGYQFFHRSLNQLTSQLIPGADGAFDMCFSPDGEWVAYVTVTPNALHKVALVGGQPQQLADQVTLGSGGFWSADNFIYFFKGGKLHRIAAAGGTAEPVPVTSELSEWSHSRPYGLPGEKHLLFTVTRGDSRDGNIALLNLETGETETLIHDAFNARYVPTGHIVFMRSTSLWAVPFDVSLLEIVGPEVPVINGVETAGNQGIANYAFSDEGLLTYLPGVDVQGGEGQLSNLVWVDREGNETVLDVEPKSFAAPRISPNEKQVAVAIGNIGNTDIWTYNLDRSTLSRRTFTGNINAPYWTPDGERLVYTFFPDFHGLAWVKADGTGQPEKLIDSQRFLFPTTFTPDGLQLIYHESLSGPTDLYTLSTTGEHTEQALLVTGYFEGNAAISPDGRWMAYQADETGRYEIYIRPFPDVDDGKWQVSTAGGIEPRWREDGKELYYGQVDSTGFSVVAVSIDTEPRFQAGTPTVLFMGDDYERGVGQVNYDVTADGQRFLMVKPAEVANSDIESQLTSLVVVENWFAELKRLAPPTN